MLDRLWRRRARRRAVPPATSRQGDGSGTSAGTAEAATLSAARQAAADGDHDAAVAGLRRLVDRDGPVPVGVYLGLARSLSALERDAEAVDVVGEGRARHDDPRLLALDARVTLRARKRAAEVDEHRYSEHLLRLDRQLRAAIDDEPRADLLVVHADLLAAFRRWPEVADRWGEVEDLAPGRGDQARLERARALRGAGAAPGPRDVLARVGGAWREHPRYRRERERLADHGGQGEQGEQDHPADVLLEQALAERRAGQPDVARQTLDAALAARGDDDAERAAAGPLLAALAGATSPHAGTTGPGPAAPTAPTGTTGPTPAAPIAPTGTTATGVGTILVSGLLYSGSGAVLEDLQGHPDVSLPFGAGEVAYLKKPGTNLTRLLDEDLRAPAAFDEAVVRLLLANLVGLGGSGAPLLGAVGAEPERRAEVLVHAARLATELQLAGRDAATAGRPVPIADVAHALTGFNARLLAALTSPGRVPLCNNVLVAHRLDHLTLFPAAHGVAVVRDPRDQYVSQRLEYAHAHPVEEFVELTRARLERLTHLVADPALAARLTVVTFEDYVDDAAVRARLWRRLGLDPARRDAAVATFEPERSRHNLGIHAGYPDQDEVAVVADHLLDAYRHLRATAT